MTLGALPLESIRRVTEYVGRAIDGDVGRHILVLELEHELLRIEAHAGRRRLPGRGYRENRQMHP